jgi:hypothetical protein
MLYIKVKEEFRANVFYNEQLLVRRENDGKRLGMRHGR